MIKFTLKSNKYSVVRKTYGYSFKEVLEHVINSAKEIAEEEMHAFESESSCNYEVIDDSNAKRYKIACGTVVCATDNTFSFEDVL